MERNGRGPFYRVKRAGCSPRRRDARSNASLKAGNPIEAVRIRGCLEYPRALLNGNRRQVDRHQPARAGSREVTLQCCRRHRPGHCVALGTADRKPADGGDDHDDKSTRDSGGDHDEAPFVWQHPIPCVPRDRPACGDVTAAPGGRLGTVSGVRWVARGRPTESGRGKAWSVGRAGAWEGGRTAGGRPEDGRSDGAHNPRTPPWKPLRARPVADAVRVRNPHGRERFPPGASRDARNPRPRYVFRRSEALAPVAPDGPMRSHSGPPAGSRGGVDPRGPPCLGTGFIASDATLRGPLRTF